MMQKEDPYNYFLNGHNPDSDADGSLVAMALDNIRASGLTPETLEQNHIRLFRGGTDTLKKRLGIGHYNGRPILQGRIAVEFPYRNEKGDVTRHAYRFFPSINGSEGDEVRYLATKDTPATPYFPAGTLDVKKNKNKPIIITEGEKKALLLSQLGRHAIGLSGVWNFRAGKGSKNTDSTVLWKDLEAFTWTGRTVYLAFDADWSTNPMVREALYTLAFTLYQRGAGLKFLTWEPSQGKGIDDCLSRRVQP